MPALADPSDAMERERRLDVVLTMVQSRLLPLLPGGVVHDTGRALWAMSAITLPGSNGVLRYDARGFRGPDSERELDTCLAVMSTSDQPWTFSVWDHLGGEILRAQLERRGFVAGSASTAVWLDLPATVPVPRPAPAGSFAGSSPPGTAATGPPSTARCSVHPPPRWPRRSGTRRPPRSWPSSTVSPSAW